MYSAPRRSEMSWFDGPVCGAISCTEPAAVRIDHPDHGERVVCSDHAEGYPVLEEVSS